MSCKLSSQVRRVVGPDLVEPVAGQLDGGELAGGGQVGGQGGQVVGGEQQGPQPGCKDRIKVVLEVA